MAKTDKAKFEDKLNELKSIADSLSDENMELERMMELYEKGIALYDECLKTLEAYEGRIKEAACSACDDAKE